MLESDTASGLNDNRKGLHTILEMVQKGEVNRIFVNHKDRLTHFGFNYIKQLCDFHHVPIIVATDIENPKSQSEELAKDIIALIHSFSGKLYGLRHKIRKELDERDQRQT